MRIGLITRRCIAWIACYAMLFAALAPSISHAIAVKDAMPLVQTDICSVHGNDEGKTTHSHLPQQGDLHMKHCAFCATHAGSFGLLPPVVMVLPSIEGVPLRPTLFYHSSHPLFIWHAAQPRAPPYFG